MEPTGKSAPDEPAPARAADRPADFTPEEWVALFPATLPPLHPYTDVEARSGRADEDPAAPARGEHPLTRDVVRRELSAFPGLAAAVFAGYRLGLSPRSLLLWYSFMYALEIALLALATAWSDGSFGVAQLAVGMLVACLVPVVGTSILLPVILSLKGWVMTTADLEPWAGLIRWLQLQRAESQGAQGIQATLTTRLVEHDPADRLCPCSAPSCAGNTPAWAGFFAWLDAIVWIVPELATYLMMCYTTYVSFGARLFSTWWGILLFASFVFSCSGTIFLGVARLSTFGNIAYYRLENRLLNRAVRIALRVALNRDADPDADYTEEKVPLAAEVSRNAPSPDLYVRLHYQLMRLWTLRADQDVAFVSQAYLFGWIPSLVVFAILYITTGRCIPAWLLVAFLPKLIFMSCNIVNLAARNASIASVVAQYHSALREIRVLSGLQVSRSPALRRHEAVLSSFLDVSGFQGKVFGLAATYGTARALLVTLVTLCVGLWSVMRNLGTAVTLESFCPYQA